MPDKKEQLKIIRKNGKTIIIVDDPDGTIANRVSRQTCLNEHLERAKEDLRNNPLPDRIIKPAIERQKALRELWDNAMQKVSSE